MKPLFKSPRIGLSVWASEWPMSCEGQCVVRIEAAHLSDPSVVLSVFFLLLSSFLVCSVVFYSVWEHLVV